jgi:hypothetical protein
MNFRFLLLLIALQDLTEQLQRAMEQRAGTVKKLDDVIVPQNARIKLDVGGKIFSVTMEMMTKVTNVVRWCLCECFSNLHF